MSQRRTAVELLAASFATLLLELALIRWLPGKVRVIAYFPNLVLIASFVGLGVGALASSRRLELLGVYLLACVLLVIGLGMIAFTADGNSEHLWLLYFDLPKNAPVVNSVVMPIALVFASVAVCFVPMGGAIASRLNSFQNQDRALYGYALDIGGSLLGALTFMALSATGTRPVWWLGGALVAAMLALPRRAISSITYMSAALVILATVHLTDNADLYSPYYAIRVGAGGVVSTNGSLHQQMLDLRVQSSQPSASVAHVRDGYRLPVDNLKSMPRRALVIGAGTGNDVTVLLDAGVPEVHAVEIDSAIIDIGRSRHPARPYLDSRVTLHNTDARGFLEHTNLKFDLIVFGTLDSMTRLSALANVRLDNFVYTVESLRAARSRLTESGGLALMFMAGKPYIESHLFALLYRAFGAPPLYLKHNYNLFNVLFLAGPGFEHLRQQPELRHPELEAMAESLQAPDDSWPFLYLERKGLPPFYIKIAAVVLMITFIMLLTTSRPLRADVIRGRVDIEMLLFGAAFLLIESSFVTDMNLLFGATWRTSAFVFAAILVALLLSTLVAARVRVDPRVALVAVIASLAFVAQLPLRTIAPTTALGRTFFALVICGVPVFCAGLAFAERFRQRTHANVAFGWNIVGAVIGGILELLSMAIGLRALFLVAALLYSSILWRCRNDNSPPPSDLASASKV